MLKQILTNILIFLFAYLNYKLKTKIILIKNNWTFYYIEIINNAVGHFQSYLNDISIKKLFLHLLTLQIFWRENIFSKRGILLGQNKTGILMMRILLHQCI